jgi:hypothetical protein
MRYACEHSVFYEAGKRASACGRCRRSPQRLAQILRDRRKHDVEADEARGRGELGICGPSGRRRTLCDRLPAQAQRRARSAACGANAL